MTTGMPRALLVAAGLAGAAAAGRAGVRWMRTWGARPDELTRTYPGDELVAEPATGGVTAVSVAAPPEAVWRWLVQLGVGRGGMYSYAWLERLIGLHVRNATEVREEWQHLEVGDRIALVPPGTAWMKPGYVLPVAAVEPPHHLVLRQAPPEHPWDAVWTFVVEPDGAGSRLLSRSRAARGAGLGARALEAVTSIGTAVTWLMTRKMLLTIKERAESVPVARAPTPTPPVA